MSRRAKGAARVEPPRLDGHAHAVYGPWAYRLASDVIEEEFGEAVRCVADALVSLGPSSQAELRTYLVSKRATSTVTGPLLSPTRIRVCLLVLLTHRCVGVSVSRSPASARAARLAAERASGGLAASPLEQLASAAAATVAGGGGDDDDEDCSSYIYGALRYSLSVGAVLRRLRFPCYLVLARRLAGTAGVAVAEQLLFHGPRHHEATIAAAAKAHVRVLVDEEQYEQQQEAAASGGGGGGASSSGGRVAHARPQRAAAAAPAPAPTAGGGSSGEISSEAAARAYQACTKAWYYLERRRLLVPEAGLVSGVGASGSVACGAGLGGAPGLVTVLPPELTGANARSRAAAPPASAKGGAAAAGRQTAAAAAATPAAHAGGAGGDDSDDAVVPASKRINLGPGRGGAAGAGARASSSSSAAAAAAGPVDDAAAAATATHGARAGAGRALKRARPAAASASDNGDNASEAGEQEAVAAAAAASSAFLADAAWSAAAPSHKQLWRFGFEAANRMLRDDLLAAHCQAVLPTQAALAAGGASSASSSASTAAGISDEHKVDSATTSLLVRTLLAMAEEHCDVAMPITGLERSPEYSVAAILNRLRRLDAGGEVLLPSAAKAYALLASLAKLPSAPLVAGEPVGLRPADDTRSFAVHYRNCALELGRKTVLSYVQDRFSLVCARVVDLLLERGALDEKSTSELAMIPSKDAKESLYRLLGDGLLQQQEVPKRPDHHPQFTFFLFRAEMFRLLSLVTERTHHALLSVRRRRRMEADRQRAAASSLVAGGGAGGQPSSSGGGGAAGAGAAGTPASTRVAAARRVQALPARLDGGVDRLLQAEGRLDATLALTRDLHWLNWAQAT